VSTIPATISEPDAFTILVAKDFPETDIPLSFGAILELSVLFVILSDWLELLLPIFVAEFNALLILSVTPCAALFTLSPVSFNLFVNSLKFEIFDTVLLAPLTTSPTPAYSIICWVASIALFWTYCPILTAVSTTVPATPIPSAFKSSNVIPSAPGFIPSISNMPNTSVSIFNKSAWFSIDVFYNCNKNVFIWSIISLITKIWNAFYKMIDWSFNHANNFSLAASFVKSLVFSFHFSLDFSIISFLNFSLASDDIFLTSSETVVPIFLNVSLTSSPASVARSFKSFPNLGASSATLLSVFSSSSIVWFSTASCAA